MNDQSMSAGVIGASPSMELVFEVRDFGSDALDIAFYRVPQMASNVIGDVVVDWGDQTVETVDCVLRDVELEAMATDPTFTALAHCRHIYASRSPKTIRISTPSGFLPLHALPRETTRILSSLPTLTLGETSKRGKPMASPIIQTLVPVGPGARSALESIPENLFCHNPQLCVFDETFIGSSIRKLPAALFSGIKRIVSMRRAFQGSGLVEIEEGALQRTNTSSVLQETFADCADLELVGDPFSGHPIPACVDGLLRGANPALFAWCGTQRRQDMGWVRPRATLADPFFAFEWKGAEPEKAEEVLSFYPIDLALDGDFCIEWGDGSVESVDWNAHDMISHVWSDTKSHRVRLHFTEGDPVRPFRLGENVTRILSPLPRLHPRRVDERGDFCGWASNCRLLTELPKDLFANNPDITNLEQAFAGCCRLRHVPDDLLTPLPRLRHLDSMFAFCNSLPALPTSFAERKRNIAMDYFVPQAEENV